MRVHAFSISALTAAAFGVLLISAASAAPAAECLAGPKAAPPQGHHWYYRVDRAAKKNCWYTRAMTGSATRVAAASRAATEASEDTAPPEEVITAPKTPPAVAPAAVAKIAPGVTTLPRRNFADARAEYVSEPKPMAAGADAAPADAQAADAAAAMPAQPMRMAFATRWPEASIAPPPEPAEIIAEPPPAEATPKAETVSSPAIPLATTVLTLIGGLAAALALAGLIARTIFGLGAGRRREYPLRDELQTRAIVDVNLPELRRPVRPRPVADPLPEPAQAEPPMNWVRVARQRSNAAITGEAVEELLARAGRRPAAPV